VIELLTPALLFLNIQLPGGSGFDLLTRLEHVPQVIFTTAHDEHALRAFEVNALDYLLKPIDPARSAAAMARVRPTNAERAPRPEAVLEQIFVRDGPRCWFIPLREVSLLTSEGNYVRLSWHKAQPLLGRALTTSRTAPGLHPILSRQSTSNHQPRFRRECGTGGEWTAACATA
jgi:two-component system, LytTR family, response regulator